MVLKRGHFGKSIRNTWRVLKCGNWRRMEQTSWTNRVRNEEALLVHRVKEDRNILNTVKRRMANWIGHILRRNCLLKHVTDGKLEVRIEMTGRRRRRCRQLLDDLREREYTGILKSKQ
jgi:hypothetical protein